MREKYALAMPPKIPWNADGFNKNERRLKNRKMGFHVKNGWFLSITGKAEAEKSPYSKGTIRASSELFHDTKGKNHEKKTVA
jgi:hypothetical protein